MPLMAMNLSCPESVRLRARFFLTALTLSRAIVARSALASCDYSVLTQ